MIFDIHKLDWDDKLLDVLGIPHAMLPQVKPSGSVFGYANINGEEIPIAGNAGDQQAALFGQCCFEKGEAKCTYGTGCFLLMNTGTSAAVSKNGLLTTIAATIGSGENSKVQYALEGSVFTGGAVIQWLRDELGIITDSIDSEYFANKVQDTGGVYLVPAFTGLGAPYWDMYARGCIIGITRGTKRAHIIRAAQESIAFQVMDILRAMENDLGASGIYDNKTGTLASPRHDGRFNMTELKVDGGASRDKFLMQFQADICDTSIIRPVVRETTALGAACLAGITVGFWKDVREVKTRWKRDSLFRPEMTADKRETLINGWHKAVGRSRGWA